jgi:mycothiol synthase
MTQSSDVESFLDGARERGEAFGLSEAKRLRIASGAPEVAMVREDDAIVAVGVAAPHRQPDGRTHWSVETTVRPDLAFAAFEGVVLDHVLALVPRGAPSSVWSSRTTLTSALEERRFVVSRSLFHMAVSLPLSTPRGDADGIRPMDVGDVSAILEVNRRAFAGHREAAELDRDGFDALANEPWFDPAGLLVAEVGDQVAGFCWTKVHPGGEGEIYRIGVDPVHHGHGIGRRLVVAGFDVLRGHPDVTHGGLWVDADNATARGLYESLGMETDRTTTEYERQPNR